MISETCRICLSISSLGWRNKSANDFSDDNMQYMCTKIFLKLWAQSFNLVHAHTENKKNTLWMVSILYVRVPNEL